MKVSRAPEKRGGTNKLWLYLSLVAIVVIAGVLITYFNVGFESLSVTGDGTGQTDSPAQASPIVAPTPTDVPEATSEHSHGPTEEPLSSHRDKPDVNFGEVLSEGLVALDLPGDATAESWYTFQVDTSTRDITLFFALYGDSPETIIRTIKIEEYVQHGDLSKAEVTLFYPEGPDRQITFDGGLGVITLAQRYEQPYGPSMFSPGLRVAMVNQKMVLTDDTGTISAQLQLDLSGLSDSEHIAFERSDPELVLAALSEIQELVEQIENKRTQ